MIVVMNSRATEDQIQAVVRRLGELGFRANISRGVERTVIGVVGQVYPSLKDQLEILPGVEQVLRVTKPYKLASREFQPVDTRFEVGGVPIGGDGVVIIAGPCSVESREQLLKTAHAVKAAGAHILRGGAFKPERRLILSGDLGFRPSAGWLRLGRRRACRSSPRCWRRRMCRWWPSTPISSRSGPATCRTSPSWRRPVARASRSW